jgi:hypothetical protein
MCHFCTNLQSLRLHNCGNISDKSLRLLFQSVTQLTDLDLRRCPSISSMTVSKVGTSKSVVFIGSSPD